MIDMHDFLLVTSALAAAAMAAIGIAGLVREWTPPWGRKVLRPKLWGFGTLLTGAGLGLYTLLGPLNGQPSGSFGPIPVLGWVVFVAGLGIQSLGLRPGRADVPAVTGKTPTA